MLTQLFLCLLWFVPAQNKFLSLSFHRKKLFVMICDSTHNIFVTCDLCRHTTHFCPSTFIEKNYFLWFVLPHLLTLFIVICVNTHLSSVMSLLLCVAACSLGASWNAHLVFCDVTAALCLCHLLGSAHHFSNWSCFYSNLSPRFRIWWCGYIWGMLLLVIICLKTTSCMCYVLIEYSILSSQNLSLKNML